MKCKWSRYFIFDISIFKSRYSIFNHRFQSLTSCYILQLKLLSNHFKANKKFSRLNMVKISDNDVGHSPSMCLHAYNLSHLNPSDMSRNFGTWVGNPFLKHFTHPKVKRLRFWRYINPIQRYMSHQTENHAIGSLKI